MGINVNVQQNSISLDQEHYIQKILEKFEMTKPVKTPIELNLQLSVDDDDATELPYRELIGTLMFLDDK